MAPRQGAMNQQGLTKFRFVKRSKIDQNSGKNGKILISIKKIEQVLAQDPTNNMTIQVTTQDTTHVDHSLTFP